MLFPTATLTNTRTINFNELAASISNAQKIHFQESCITSTYKNPPWWFPLPVVKNFELMKPNKDCAKIAIIGGGLCGVTAAKAIANKIPLSGPGRHCEITVFESDPMSLLDESNDATPHEYSKTKVWKAAAARNANSLVPGAAMHIMSQRKVIYRIVKDHFGVRPVVVFNKSPTKEDFSEIPQYFGFDFLKCVGWSTPREEKIGFFTFMYHFLKISMFDTEEGIKLRGKYLVQLANANMKILQEDELFKKLGHQSGFISVHRTLKAAEDILKEVKEFGEDGELIPKEIAEDLEPRLKIIPFDPSFYVHRKDDSAANCHAFIISSIKSLMKKGVKYENNLGRVTHIRINSSNAPNNMEDRFTISTSEGNEMTYDYVIVANGIHSPILMSSINNSRARLACPVYPLKGYSLTLRAPLSNKRDGGKTTFLNKAMSFDNIYCTSVDYNHVRMAGFGEISGWPSTSSKNDYLISSTTAKSVLEKYARALFQIDMIINADDVLPCYRPMSPDDIPIVGEVKVDGVKGLYLHTGHSTLGWTLCSATAECLSQSICDDINGNEESGDYFILPDGMKIKKSILSPNRFI